MMNAAEHNLTFANRFNDGTIPSSFWVTADDERWWRANSLEQIVGNANQPLKFIELASLNIEAETVKNNVLKLYQTLAKLAETHEDPWSQIATISSTLMYDVTFGVDDVNRFLHRDFEWFVVDPEDPLVKVTVAHVSRDPVAIVDFMVPKSVAIEFLDDTDHIHRTFYEAETHNKGMYLSISHDHVASNAVIEITSVSS